MFYLLTQVAYRIERLSNKKQVAKMRITPSPQPRYASHNLFDFVWSPGREQIQC